MMKKIFLFMALIILCFSFATIAISATETDIPQDIITETFETVTEDHETETMPVDSSELDITSDKYARQFVDYIFSGAPGSTELMDKIIAMGEQFAEQKEAGYTFKERIEQLVTPDNMITSISALFLVICGIAIFVFKNWQKRSSLALHRDIGILKDKYDEERKENQKLREDVTTQTKEIEELKALIVGLCERSDLSKSDMDHIHHTATAVAKMVKDVFLNSKTIDASGKSLLVHNYLEAVGEEANVQNE